MNISIERKLAARATAIGESASVEAFPELAELCHSESPLVRRLAASALGKLAGIVDSAASVDLLRQLLPDMHPQVRQYAAKALGAFGVAVEAALHDFDLYIEYWGMEDNLDYQIGMMEKKKLYQQSGKKLVSLYAHEKPRLGETLREKLGKHVKLG